jgi:transposase
MMDNASFHRGERVEPMCREAGVELLYLRPYSPDLNPIEEFLAELKAFIKKQLTFSTLVASPLSDIAILL